MEKEVKLKNERKKYRVGNLVEGGIMLIWCVRMRRIFMHPIVDQKQEKLWQCTAPVGHYCHFPKNLKDFSALMLSLSYYLCLFA